jgi:hypothetical protein
VRYLMLLNNSAEDAALWATLGEDESERIRAADLPRWGPIMQRLQEGGHAVAGLELDLPATAKTVRVRDGETTVTDGPYAETRELVGGYFVAECESLDEAIELAALIPVAERGSIEIRPLATGEEPR